jgi:hypothetical protein
VAKADQPLAELLHAPFNRRAARLRSKRWNNRNSKLSLLYQFWHIVLKFSHLREKIVAFSGKVE